MYSHVAFCVPLIEFIYHQANTQHFMKQVLIQLGLVLFPCLNNKTSTWNDDNGYGIMWSLCFCMKINNEDHNDTEKKICQLYRVSNYELFSQQLLTNFL